MQNVPSVTVVIPTYNAQAFIEETLRSVLDQRGASLEVIVVDDGSTDGTCAIVEGMDSRIRLVRQTRGGVCVARNRGLAEARAPFICFLDHDDVWHPDKTQAQLRAFDEHPDAVLVHTDYVMWRQGPDARFAPAASLLDAQPDTALDPDNSGWAYHHLLVDSFILTSTAMLRTEAVREVGGFDPALPYSEDWDLWLRLSRLKPFVKLRGRFALYRQLPTQGSRVARDVDYRTELLKRAIARWGTSSPNGEAHDERLIQRRMGWFHAEYGLQCLQAGAVARARRSLWQAWRCDPAKPKYLAYLACGSLGWRPRW